MEIAVGKREWIFGDGYDSLILSQEKPIPDALGQGHVSALIDFIVVVLWLLVTDIVEGVVAEGNDSAVSVMYLIRWIRGLTTPSPINGGPVPHFIHDVIVTEVSHHIKLSGVHHLSHTDAFLRVIVICLI